jgi:transcription termination factor Rho
MTIAQLQQAAKDARIPREEYAGLKKQDLVYRILRELSTANGLMFGEGTLEVLPDGFGFLRSPDYNYLPCPDDIYISPSQIRRFGLRTGAVGRRPDPPAEGERAVLRAAPGRGHQLLRARPAHPEGGVRRPHPAAPEQPVAPGGGRRAAGMRVIDLITPIGKGQRGLIVAPPRTGKTVLPATDGERRHRQPPGVLRHRAAHRRAAGRGDGDEPERERPAGGGGEQHVRRADRPTIQVAEMVGEKAKRLVEFGNDVVIFLDSITRLARAYNNEAPSNGKLLSGGLDAESVQKPKRFFGRRPEHRRGRLLTILATALVTPGRRWTR